MTVSRRKNKPVAKADDKSAAESGVQYHCDVCGLDISSTVRISCATCENQPGALDTYDLCCCCFLEGAESGSHKANHDYRVVEQHAYPIFCNDWGADEELLLIDGAQIYGLGNWADIADHIGNRTKEEVEDHYIKVFIEGKDGTQDGDIKSEEIVRSFLATRHPLEARKQQLPIAGPNIAFDSDIDAEEFQRRKRQRIDDMRKDQAAFSVMSSSQTTKDSQSNSTKPVPPKPLVSAPTSHSELGGFMPGRLEFETEYEQEAENYVKDMEFGKVYRYGGEKMPDELEALGGLAEKGKSRMEASGRGGPSVGGRGANKANKGAKGEDEEGKEKEESDGEGEGEEEEGEKEADEEDEEDKEEEETEEVEEPSQMDTSAFDGEDTQMGQGTNAANTAVASSQAAPADTDDRAPDWDENEGDLELKLCILDIYNERLDRRGRRKEFIFGRNLVDYKRTVAAERKRPKEERELLNRVRHFAQMQTAFDFEEFFNGLCYEDALRRAASQLQMYRRAGITNLTDAARFDSEQAERTRKALVAAEGGLAAFPAGGSLPRSAAARNARDTSITGGGGGGGGDDGDSGTATPTTNKAPTNKAKPDEKKAPRKPPKPLDLSQNPSLRLLTAAEQELCSVVRIQPQVFLLMKKEIILEYVKRKGRFTRRESRVLFKCDVNKVGRVYDLLESEGYLREAARLGGKWNGMGTPPGWVERVIPPSTTNTSQAESTNSSQPSPQVVATLPAETSSSTSSLAPPTTTTTKVPAEESNHQNSHNQQSQNSSITHSDEEQQTQHSQQKTLTA